MRRLSLGFCFWLWGDTPLCSYAQRGRGRARAPARRRRGRAGPPPPVSNDPMEVKESLGRVTPHAFGVAACLGLPAPIHLHTLRRLFGLVGFPVSLFLVAPLVPRGMKGEFLGRVTPHAFGIAACIGLPAPVRLHTMRRLFGFPFSLLWDVTPVPGAKRWYGRVTPLHLA